MHQRCDCGPVVCLATRSKKHAIRSEVSHQKFDVSAHVQPGDIHANICTSAHGIEHTPEASPHFFSTKKRDIRKFRSQIDQVSVVDFAIWIFSRTPYGIGETLHRETPYSPEHLCQHRRLYRINLCLPLHILHPSMCTTDHSPCEFIVKDQY